MTLARGCRVTILVGSNRLNKGKEAKGAVYARLIRHLFQNPEPRWGELALSDRVADRREADAEAFGHGVASEGFGEGFYGHGQH